MSEFPILGGMSLDISVCAERLKGARPTVDCPWALPGAAEIDKRKGQVRAGQILARVHDVQRTGAPAVEYRARLDGLLVGRHFPGLVQGGDCFGEVAVPER